jgi:hypothetical protein
MHDKGLARRVCENTADVFLLEWLATYVANEPIDLPVYQARLRDVAGRNIWGLDFRATASDSKFPDENVPAQNFIVYSTQCEFHQFYGSQKQEQ